MMRSSNADVLLSLDDDSYPVELDSIKRIEQLFAHNPRLAIAAFPQRSDEYPDTLSVSDFGPAHFIGTFSNAGTAIRRSTFLEVGGYPLQFGHAYEEPDFALRCLAAGFEVKFEPTLTIRHHYTTAQRNEMRTHHSHARNELWSVILRCPLPQLLLVAFFRIARQLGYARKRGWSWVLREPIWWLRCLRGIPHALAKRSPIAWSRYRGWMELVRRPIFDRSEWKRKFAAGRK
jgi:GT2 family glycosyltransferase